MNRLFKRLHGDKIGLVLLTISIALSISQVPGISVGYRVASGALALLILIGSLARRWRRAYGPNRRFEQHGNTPDEEPVDHSGLLDWVDDLEVFTEPDEIKQTKLLAYMIIHPEQMRTRVIEEFTPGRRALHQKVTIDLRIDQDLLPSKSDSKILIPLLVPAKGDLHDNFRVENSNGDVIPTLSNAESIHLMVRVVKSFVEASGSEKVLPLRIAASRIAAWKSDFKGSRNEEATARELFSYLTDKPASEVGEAVDSPEVKTAAQLVERLSKAYAIIAVADNPADGRLTLSYSRMIIPTRKRIGEPKSIPGRFKLWLRMALGARPVFVELQVDNAWTCGSYHMQVMGPEGLYLAHQRLTISAEHQRLLDGNTGTRRPIYQRPYFRFRQRLGQRYAHFYAQNFPPPPQGTKPPSLAFTFYETPPGSDLQATIAAASAFLLIWLVAFAIATGGRTMDLGSDAPVLLLAFPGAAAGWVGLDTPDRLLAGSLSARLSLICTVLVSIGASALFMLNRSAAWPAILERSSISWSMLGIHNYCWIAITGTAFANAGFIGYRWFLRSIAYGQLASRTPLE